MAENVKNIVNREEIKQRDFAESETKYYARRPDENVENAIFRTRDKDAPILGERYNTENHCRSNEKREAPYANGGRHKKCNWMLSE